jgi:diaminopropionate ammonia-lyase
MQQPSFYINNAMGLLPNNSTTQILAEANSLAYHQQLPNYEPSPLVSLKGLSQKLGVQQIWVKDESTRFGLNAFKALGASFAINKLLQKNNAIACFCTATDGNHGRAVAWAAAIAGKKAVIYMPKGSAASRVKAIVELGGSVIVTEGNYDQTCALAQEACSINNWQLVQDAAWEGYEEIPAYIKAGYLTHFKEMENSLHAVAQPMVDFVFLQAGVGSWAAAAAWYYTQRYGSKKPTLILVEPTESDGLHQSFINGKRSLPKGSLHTMMAGLNCGIPTKTGWEILSQTINYSITVTEAAAALAMKTFYLPNAPDAQIFAGESGAAGLAGLQMLLQHPNFEAMRQHCGIGSSSTILLYNTEGITDPENFEKVVGQLV